MIQIGDLALDLSDPVILLALALGGLVFVLLIMSLLSARRAAKLSEPLVYQLAQVGQRVQNLSDGQERLSGGLTHVSEAQAQSQTAMLQLMEQRLSEVQERMNVNLHGSARRTAQSLGELQQRLTAIDKAQENITKLSGDVLSLQDILSNKQTRGAFGETWGLLCALRDRLALAFATRTFLFAHPHSIGRVSLKPFLVSSKAPSSMA